MSGSKKQKKQAKKDSKSTNKKTNLIILILILVISISIFAIIYFGGKTVEAPKITSQTTGKLSDYEKPKYIKSKQIYQGVTVGGIDLGGLSKEAAKKVLADNEAKIMADFKVRIWNKNYKSFLLANELGLKIDLDQTVNTAYDYLRAEMAKEDPKKAGKKLEKLAKKKKESPIFLTSDAKKIEQIVKDVATKVDQKAVEPTATSFDASSEKFIISDSQIGYTVDQPALKDIILKAIKEQNFKEEIQIPTQVDKPKRSKEELSKHLAFRSEAITYGFNDYNRNVNIARSLELTNGTIIQPGAIYSFLSTIGPQTYANGYVNAGIQIAGRDTEGIAGGICQSSTTVFQAAAMTSLTMYEHHNHGIPSVYCPIGIDAMVDDEGGPDLKFKNDSEFPYAIVSYFDWDTYGLVVRFYGPPNEHNAKIELYVEQGGYIEPGPDIVKVDKKLKPGEKKIYRARRQGTSSNTYRNFYVDGKLIKSEFLISSHYDAYPGITLVGPKESSTTSTTTTATTTAEPVSTTPPTTTEETTTTEPETETTSTESVEETTSSSEETEP